MNFLGKTKEHTKKVKLVSSSQRPPNSMVLRDSITEINDNITAFIDAYDEAMLLLDHRSTDTKSVSSSKEHTHTNEYANISIQSTEEGFELTPVLTRDNSRRQIQNFFSHLIKQNNGNSNRNDSEILVTEKKNSDSLPKSPSNNHQEDECSWVDGAQVVSRCILAGVNLLKHRIDHKIENVSQEIEDGGEVYKERINAEKGKNGPSPEDKHMNEIVILTGSVNKASHDLRNNTAKVALGIRSIATNKIVEIVDEMEEAEIGKLIIPNEENREILAAVGKVALTALGAAQISFETMYDTTETVALKSNTVAADVISCKYGPTAGKVVEDTGDSLYNTFRALKLFSLFNPEVMAVSVVKYTGKVSLPVE